MPWVRRSTTRADLASPLDTPRDRREDPWVSPDTSRDHLRGIHTRIDPKRVSLDTPGHHLRVLHARIEPRRVSLNTPRYHLRVLDMFIGPELAGFRPIT